MTVSLETGFGFKLEELQCPDIYPELPCAVPQRL